MSTISFRPLAEIRIQSHKIFAIGQQIFIFVAAMAAFHLGYLIESPDIIGMVNASALFLTLFVAFDISKHSADIRHSIYHLEKYFHDLRYNSPSRLNQYENFLEFETHLLTECKKLNKRFLALTADEKRSLSKMAITYSALEKSSDRFTENLSKSYIVLLASAVATTAIFNGTLLGVNQILLGSLIFTELTYTKRLTTFGKIRKSLVDSVKSV